MNENTKKAVLMSKNTPLLLVLLENNMVVKIIKVINDEKLPFSLKDNLNIKSINTWIKKRLISDSREGFAEAKKVFMEINDFGSMFSLTDQYWFKFGNKQTWEEGNFFNKRYDRNFGYMFFYPWEVEKSRLGLPSPDMTTNGLTRKRWIQNKGEFNSYLIKSRDKDGVQDPINEVIASKFLKNMNFIDVVEYDLIIDGLRFSSMCPNFIDENTEFVPASHICINMSKKSKLDFFGYLVQRCNELGLKNADDFLNRMITADYLIKNVDRHYGNFGFIRDVESGKLIKFAPLFDFGLSFTNKEERKTRKHFFSEERVKEALKYTKDKYKISIAQKDKESLLEVLDYYPFMENVNAKKT